MTTTMLADEMQTGVDTPLIDDATRTLDSSNRQPLATATAALIPTNTYCNLDDESIMSDCDEIPNEQNENNVEHSCQNNQNSGSEQKLENGEDTECQQNIYCNHPDDDESENDNNGRDEDGDVDEIANVVPELPRRLATKLPCRHNCSCNDAVDSHSSL